MKTLTKTKYYSYKECIEIAKKAKSIWNIDLTGRYLCDKKSNKKYCNGAYGCNIINKLKLLTGTDEVINIFQYR